MEVWSWPGCASRPCAGGTPAFPAWPRRPRRRRERRCRTPSARTAAVLEAALPRRPRSARACRCRRMVGLGPGLTPAGDDVLAGALVALAATSARRSLARLASGGPPAPAPDDGAVGRAARARSGRPRDPAARGVTSSAFARGPLHDDVVQDLERVGATSGAALAAGARIGCASRSIGSEGGEGPRERLPGTTSGRWLSRHDERVEVRPGAYHDSVTLHAGQPGVAEARVRRRWSRWPPTSTSSCAPNGLRRARRRRPNELSSRCATATRTPSPRARAAVARSWRAGAAPPRGDGAPAVRPRTRPRPPGPPRRRWP